jgi:hypothetical protein
MLLALIVAASTAAASTTVGADTFRQARASWGVSYPPYAFYKTVVRYDSGDASMVRRWDTVEDLRRRSVHAAAVSDHDAAAPHVPSGTDAGVYGSLSWNGRGIVLGPKTPKAGGMPTKGVIVNRERDIDAIGPMSLAINQDFGIAPSLPAVTASRVAGSIASRPGLAQIGRTGASASDYEIAVLDVRSEAGADAIVHLQLRPIRLPYRYRLREMWIDPSSGRTISAIVAGIGDRAPFDSVPWRIDFRSIDGATYLDRETALAPLTYRGALCRDVVITFENVQFSDTLPLESQLGIASTAGIMDP